MPKTKGEPTKKHGDPLEELIDRTGNASSPKRGDESANDDEELNADEDVDEDDDERN